MSKQGLPKEVELKKKLIICPKCKTHIEVDLVFDITNIIGAFQAMGNLKKMKGK